MVTPGANCEELQALVGRALVDPSFRKDLLNGHRVECLSEFELTNEEFDAARSIRAGDLTSFAGQLDEWIRERTAEHRANAVATLRQTPFAAAA